MLTNLAVKNYALIDDLNVAFSDGFTTITGETGAGKSILLGALSLVLGKRADLSSLREKEKKCIIEAEFAIENYNLKDYFQKNELEYENHTIVRREILPSGKSRAFINDSPVSLSILAGLGQGLVDVHSQHQTLQLTENEFQMRVIDALASNQQLISDYTKTLYQFQKQKKELEELITSKDNTTKEIDYNTFLLKELTEAALVSGMQQPLEEEYEQLNNVEQILEHLGQAHGVLNQEQYGVLASLLLLNQSTQKLTDFGEKYQSLYERVASVKIELDDVFTEVEQLMEQVEVNPQRLDEVNTQLQKIYELQKKHQVATVDELIEIRENLSEKVVDFESLDASILEKENTIKELELNLIKLAEQMRAKRLNVIPELQETLLKNLQILGMPAASFKIEITPSANYFNNGMDNLSFLFSANKGSNYGELKKVASGGELSRIMLIIKSIIAEYEHLPTIMFDEIDTGVSGEISGKMGEIMKQMGNNMQVFSITHLPQVASKGKQQFKVFKEEHHEKTTTQIKLLSEKERVIELAEMLGGKQISDSALAHAKVLLKAM